MSQADLLQIFQSLNEEHFGRLLPACDLLWNTRLRVVAGRFTPKGAGLIEVAHYLLGETDGVALVRDTLGHEMIHYWLWLRKRPYGHTGEFLAKMRSMGVSRYNHTPKRREFRHLYRCPQCQKDFPSRRRIRGLACRTCCNRYNGGRYDVKFALHWVGPWEAAL